MSVEEADRLAEAWSAGSYGHLAEKYLPMAARLVEDAAVVAEDVVLDVGCGTGNVAITAARRDAEVSGLDITPGMLERARRTAADAGVDGIEWREGTATALPYEADTFDATLSALGHMYADPPADAAEELLRVTRPGGHVGFTAWTPTSLFPTMAGLLAASLPADARPDFSSPPFAWGDPDVVTDRLAGAATDLAFETGTVRYPAVTPEAFWREQLDHSGVFATFLDDVEDRSTLGAKMVDAIEPFFAASENVVELEYLETTATVTRSG